MKNLGFRKVALLHDWLTGFRGGERVLEAFAEVFLDAELYTLIHVPHSTSNIIEQRNIYASFLNLIPNIKKHYRKFLPLMPLAAQNLKINPQVDFVLSSSHCVIKGVQKPAHSLHISYVHSPMRYLYDQFDVYFGKDAPFYQRWGALLFKKYLIAWDKRSNQNVDLMIANSHFVRERIKTYYGIEAMVLHPFVDLKDFRPWQNLATPVQKEDYYLMVTAFAPNKRVDLAIEAFNCMQKKLVIIGSGQQEAMLKKMAGPHITFLGNVDRQKVIQTFVRARALIFPGVEDFGITPLESLAAGTPVIAYKKGGVLETLNEDVAHFFSEVSTRAMIQAVDEFEQREAQFQREDLYQRAECFSKEVFVEKLQKIILEFKENYNK